MAGNKFVGRTVTNDNGLVLQSKTEIDCNEFGMLQGTFKFSLKNENWPALDLPQGTPLDEFTAGDSLTQSVFTAYANYLGKQTSRFIRNGVCPGVGTLEMVCQGANTDQSTIKTITSIDVSNKGSGYSAAPSVTIVLRSGTQLRAPLITVGMELSTNTVFAGGTGYVANDIVTVLGGTWGRPVRVKVLTAGTGGSIKPSDGAVLQMVDRGLYSALPANHCSVSGGTGSGATLDITWRVSSILVDYGGQFSSVTAADITATLTSGNAALGAVHLDNETGDGSTLTTVPWKPISTTKDTAQFTIYGQSSTTTATVKYATTADLGDARYNTMADGRIQLQSTGYGRLQLYVDTYKVSVGDIILVKNEALSYRNGIYIVAYTGWQQGFPWQLLRLDGYDAASGFTTGLRVEVQSGSANRGTLWGCDVNVSTLCPGDGSAGDNITFSTNITGPTSVPTKRITIDYHTIDLHFEYVANRKLDQPLFIASSYAMDGAGYIITDSDTGEKQLLQIDSILGEDITIDSTTGNTQYTPTSTPVTRDEWVDQVVFSGTAARFEQIPAGQFWHITETSTIKIIPARTEPV